MQVQLAQSPDFINNPNRRSPNNRSLVQRDIIVLLSRVASMTKRLVAVGLVLFLTSLSFSGKKKPEKDPIMPDVTARGRALYEYDQAAWHATDAVQATHPPAQSLGRYIA